MADKNIQISVIKKDFAKLAAAVGMSSKRRLINGFKGTITNRALRMYLDPNVKFKLHTNADESDTPEFQSFFALCKYLQESGGKDVERIFLESVNADLRVFVRDYLRKNIPLGVTLEDFNSCNPDKPIVINERKTRKARKPVPVEQVEVPFCDVTPEVPVEELAEQAISMPEEEVCVNW